jgi:CheY-like chemotaxis protein
MKVLLVDDSEDTREAMELALQLEGAFVTCADSAAAALAILEKETPHVVLADISMPHQDGFYLVRQIRERDDSLPVIALTGHAGSEMRSRTQQAGFQAHLSKPVQLDRLIEMIRQLAAAE